MAISTRSKVVELSEHSATQVFTMWMLVAAFTAALFLFVATPLLGLFFQTFLRSEIISDGRVVVFQVSENRPEERIETGATTVWALADPRVVKGVESLPAIPRPDRPLIRAEYLFRPLLSLGPLVLVGGFVGAALLTSMLPFGYLRQKIEREILLAMDRLAFSQYGEHTPQEIDQLTREIVTADTRKLHDLADIYRIPFTELELLRQALMWKDASGANRILKTHDAVKFYMREYFTERYSNAILGLVYMGAAVLIIVIGVRGLKFLPASDPSMVLAALGLEFMLLISYAAVLMYGRTEETLDHLRTADSRGLALEGMSDQETERLIRALLVLPREKNTGPER